jgi:hypothetical protein
VSTIRAYLICNRAYYCERACRLRTEKQHRIVRQGKDALRTKRSVIRGHGILLFAAVDALVLEHYQFDTDPDNIMHLTLQDLLADGADAVMQCFVDTYVEPFALSQPFRGSCNVLQGQRTQKCRHPIGTRHQYARSNSVDMEKDV